MTTDRELLVRMRTACHTLGLDKARAGALGALGELLDLVTVHLNATPDPECSCDSGPDYDGPSVECDLHGQPSKAYDTGARDALGNFAAVLDVTGHHPLAEQAREYGRSFGQKQQTHVTDPWTPCPNCHRYPQAGERHLVVAGVSGPEDSPEPDYVCLDAADETLQPAEVVLGLVTQIEPVF